MNKAITFYFKDKSFEPKSAGMKLAIYRITDGEKTYYDYGFSEWDGKEFGLPMLPYPGMTIEIESWAETVDPFSEFPKIIRINKKQ
jgi:hypothetical protein